MTCPHVNNLGSTASVCTLLSDAPRRIRSCSSPAAFLEVNLTVSSCCRTGTNPHYTSLYANFSLIIAKVLPEEVLSSFAWVC